VSIVATGAHIVSREHQDRITMDGEVVALHRDRCDVRLDGGQVIRALFAGRLWRHRIRVVVGDKVLVEMTPYDLTRGRITYRHK
jgi:translation initiation factor IF-1